MELRGADLSEAILSTADLSGASLTGVNLADADLSGANLSGANLIDADLSGAKLHQADLSRFFLDDLDDGVTGGGADLTGADLSGADLSGANLSWADLTRPTFPTRYCKTQSMSLALQRVTGSQVVPAEPVTD